MATNTRILIPLEEKETYKTVQRSEKTLLKKTTHKCSLHLRIFNQEMQASAASTDLILLPSTCVMMLAILQRIYLKPKNHKAPRTSTPEHIYQCSHQPVYNSYKLELIQWLPTATLMHLNARKEELPCTHII